jgi:hypothetical protein
VATVSDHHLARAVILLTSMIQPMDSSARSFLTIASCSAASMATSGTCREVPPSPGALMQDPAGPAGSFHDLDDRTSGRRFSPKSFTAFRIWVHYRTSALRTRWR